MSVPRPRDVSILRRNRPFRRFFVARTVSHVGDGAAVLALILYARSTGGSGTAVGALLLAQSLPHLAAPVAGTIVDRVDRRRLMIACDLCQAVLFAVIGWWLPSFPVLLALIVVTSLLDTTFGPAGQSALPGLVPAADLLEANAWTSTSLNLQVALGPILGGALVTAFGIRWALTANAASFLGSAAILATLPALPISRTSRTRGLWGASREGLSAAWGHPVVRAVLFALFFGVTFAAIGNVALVFLVRDTLGAGSLGFGVASGAFGAGMIVGSLAISLRARRAGPVRLILLSWLLSGLGPLATGLAPNLSAGIAAQTVGGIGNGVDLVAGATIVQRAIPQELLGRVFGLVGMAAFAGSSAAFVLGGLLLEFTSPRSTFVIAGVGVLTVWGVVVAMLWRYRDDLRPPEPSAD
jgi:MFS family permease